MEEIAEQQTLSTQQDVKCMGYLYWQQRTERKIQQTQVRYQKQTR